VTLSLPTLFTVLIVNFLAIGLLWTYVAYSYRNFVAARFWALGSFIAMLGAATSLTRGMMHPLIPILCGGGLMVLAASTAAMGIKRFCNRPASWWTVAIFVGATVTGMAFVSTGFDDVTARVVIFSIGQMAPLIWVLRDLLSRDSGMSTPGVRLTGYISLAMILIHATRAIVLTLGYGGRITLLEISTLQTVVIVTMVFISMAWNFSFLMMAIDRLRAEVAELALVDDLTGVANRRQLLKRLSEQCAMSYRTAQPFALMVIDIDRFKGINDAHGHAAGDACLRTFVASAQGQLRPGDLLARSGGDEFCVLLPCTTPHEAETVARRLVEAVRDRAAFANNMAIALTISAGVAQWGRDISRDQLMANADQALYRAKKQGRNGYATFGEPGQAIVEPEPEPMRRIA
jgi:diguanylate cyclase (GGDEF)-like protein